MAQPTIPSSLQPPAKAITVSQQNLIRQYGSLQGAYQAQTQQIQDTRQRQLAQLQSEIERSYQLIEGYANTPPGASLSFRRRQQAARLGEVARLEQLQSALSELQQSGTSYKSLTPVLQSARQVGATRRQQEVAMFERIKGKERAKTRKKKQEGMEVTDELIEPEIITPELAPSAEQIIKPGQGLYASIEEVRSPTATIYTSPMRTGPTLTPDQLKYARPIPKGEPLAGQGSSLLIGGQEFETVTQPEYLSSGTFYRTRTGMEDVQVVQGKTITADYSTGVSLIRRAEELIPGAGVPITTFEEDVYTPDARSTREFENKLTSMKPGAARELRKFLRDQQAQLKTDMGRYNALLLKYQNLGELSDKETKDFYRLQNRLNTGQKGTVRDVVRGATRDSTFNFMGKRLEGRKGYNVLTGLQYGYQAEKKVLQYQVGAGIAGKALGASKVGRGVLGFVSKVSKPLRYVTPGIIPLAGGSVGYSVYKKTGDIEEGIAAGIGTGMGIGAALYSKQIVEGISRSSRGAFRFGGKVLRGSEKYFGKIEGKRGMGTVEGAGKSRYAEQELQKYEAEKVSKRDIEDYLIKRKSSNPLKAAKEMIEVAKRSSDPKNVKKVYDIIKDIYDKETAVRAVQSVYMDKTFVVGEVPTVTKSSSIYYGQGTYETTKFTGAPRIADKGGDTLFGGLSEPETSTASTLLFGLGSIGEGKIKRKYDTRLSTKQKPEVDSGVGLGFDFGPVTGTKSGSGLASGSVSITNTTVTYPGETITGTIVGGRGPTRPRRVPPTKPPKIVIPEIPFFGGGTGFKKESRVAYEAYAYEDGRYKKVSKPSTMMGALDSMARYVDTNITARGKIKKVTQTKTIKGKKVKVAKVFDKPLASGDGYYNANSNKFRNYRISKGRRVPSNTYIEKKQFRLDSPKETGKIVSIRQGPLGGRFSRKGKGRFRL